MKDKKEEETIEEETIEEKKAIEEEETIEEEKISIAGEIFQWMLTTIYALFFGLFLALVVFINSSVPTGSMIDTINIGDKLIGFRLSYLFKDPKRFDVIIFKFPDDKEVKIVKRIIGLPNDKINIKQGKIYINDEDVPLDDSFIYNNRTSNETMEPIYVPEDSYFVIGDNRNNSFDSRHWNNQFVKEEDIISQVFVTYHPKFKIFLFENMKYEK